MSPDASPTPPTLTKEAVLKIIAQVSSNRITELEGYLADLEDELERLQIGRHLQELKEMEISLTAAIAAATPLVLRRDESKDELVEEAA